MAALTGRALAAGVARASSRAPGARGLALLLAFWSAVGLASGLQHLAATALAGGEPAPWSDLVRGWSAGLLWVPLTLLLVGLQRRVPLRLRPGDGPSDAAPGRTLAVHAVAGLLAPLLYNVAFTALHLPADSAADVARSAAEGWLRWLHISAPVCWAIVAADAWRLRRAEPPGPGPSAARPASPPAIRVRSGGRVRLVPAAGVLWIEAAGDYVRLHTEEGRLLASHRLKALAARLEPHGFLRIHRSTVVNLARVRAYRPLGHGDYRVVLEDGTELRASRTRGGEFRRRIASRTAGPGP